MKYYGVHVGMGQQDKQQSVKQMEHMLGLMQAVEEIRVTADDDGKVPIPKNAVQDLFDGLTQQRRRRGTSTEGLEELLTSAATTKELDGLKDEFMDGAHRAKAATEVAVDLEEALLAAHGFSFEGGIPELLLETSAPHPERLPFASCFLDTELVVDGWRLEGIHVIETDKPENLSPGGLYNPEPRVEPPEDFFIGTYATDGKQRVPVMLTYHLDNDPTVGLIDTFGKRTIQRIKKTLRNFVASWAAFVNDPDIIIVETCKSPNARLKVQRQHGAVPQSMRAIRLTGVLRKYVQDQRNYADEVERKGNRVHWVRGHYRRLMSNRYTPEVRGSVTWVPPHVRGTGSAPLKRTYEVGLEKNA